MKLSQGLDGRMLWAIICAYLLVFYCMSLKGGDQAREGQSDLVNSVADGAVTKICRQVDGSPGDTLDALDVAAVFGKDIARAVGASVITDADTAAFRKLTRVIE